MVSLQIPHVLLAQATQQCPNWGDTEMFLSPYFGFALLCYLWGILLKQVLGKESEAKLTITLGNGLIKYAITAEMIIAGAVMYLSTLAVVSYGFSDIAIETFIHGAGYTAERFKAVGALTMVVSWIVTLLFMGLGFLWGQLREALGKAHEAISDAEAIEQIADQIPTQ